MKVEIEINEHRVLILALGGALGVFALHAAYPGLYGYWPQSSQDLAAWVQAVGSVAAIVGAVWATKYQIRRAKEVAFLAERQKALHLSMSALHVAARSHRLAKNAVRGVKEWERFGTFMVNTDAKFRSAVGSAEIVLAKDLDAEVLQQMLDVRSLLAIVVSALELMRSDEPNDRTVAKVDITRAKVGLVHARWYIRQNVRALERELQSLRGS